MRRQPGFILTWMLAGGVVLGALVGGCGGAAATGDVDKIAVTNTSLDVTVTNTSGGTLTNVRVEVLPVGKVTSYRTTIPRMDNGEHRDLDFGKFADTDGVTFTPRNVKATAVAVTASDLNGKELHVEVPWKK